MMSNANKMDWVCYLMISNHMWDDEYSPSKFHNMPKRYNPENVNEESFWDEIISFLAECKYTAVFIEIGDAVIFDKHPEIAAPNAWTKEKFRGLLDKFRKVGIDPWPRLDFSACHDLWTKDYRFKFTLPEYYTFVTDTIDEVCDLFDKPKYFDIVMDEENVKDQKGRAVMRIRNDQLYWHDVKLMIDRIESNGVRAVMAADYFWHKPDLFVQNVPKSVLVRNWFYDYFIDWPEDSPLYPGMHSYKKLDELGYEQIATCSTWLRNENPAQTVVNVSKDVSPERLLGFMTALWATMRWDNEYYLKNDIYQLYLARKKYRPDTL